MAIGMFGLPIPLRHKKGNHVFGCAYSTGNMWTGCNRGFVEASLSSRASDSIWGSLKKVRSTELVIRMRGGPFHCRYRIFKSLGQEWEHLVIKSRLTTRTRPGLGPEGHVFEDLFFQRAVFEE
ncbi:hypothetical protein AVEN_232835-1 [Araneus ventricosus]|uniref:Uncharacterized protein n=1 Tax=Araneus ventricosus TaxID=182803 RepID=A0A4Y2UXW6_ARAVE|nr:hypothetical protein AVEN_174268-1 [Araneus ventricosus]GBO16648.1 hypothetical protein AVEN_232835-1 [Araneus ventricosus]